jgi:5'-nucleotidase
MKLLVSNDDGISALGIRTLANHLVESGHEVIVVCPDRERSATGHGLTLLQPIRAEIVNSIFHPAVTAWSCDGTPSDCVKLALWALLDSPPDLVLSGINQGANLGTEILYSGTVSAAMEGLLEGIPSIALSLTSRTSQDFQPAARVAQLLVEKIITQPLPELMMLNVNIPPVPWEKIAGITFTRQGVRRYVDVFDKRVDPRGKTYYWLTGEVLEDIQPPTGLNLPDDIPIDVNVIRDNFVSVTPLQYNLTYATGLHQLSQWEVKFP